MKTRKIPQISYGVVVFLLALLVVAGSFLFPASHMAYAHTFSISESAQFLSLVEQIRAETRLIIMNVESDNVTLAQAHAQKAATLPDNITISEIRERNNRIADSLVTGLEQLEGNVTSLASEPQEQIPQVGIQSINQSVASLNDVLAEAVTVRVESEQQNNVTTWAMVLAELTIDVLNNYGNATAAPFDLTNMSNLPATEGTQMDLPSNTTTTTTIVDTAAYQSAQYLANNTILQLFNDTLRPLTISTNDTTTDNTNATLIAQEEQGNLTSDNINVTSTNIDELEAGLIQLRDDINNKATPIEVMRTVHLGIHPLLIQLYGLTLEQEGEEEHSDHTAA
jgi:hypothetical protein